jgi:hypothetical protein
MKKDMNTLYFTQQFPDETACRKHLLPESKYAVISVIKDVSISENSDA